MLLQHEEISKLVRHARGLSHLMRWLFFFFLRVNQMLDLKPESSLVPFTRNEREITLSFCVYKKKSLITPSTTT